MLALKEKVREDTIIASTVLNKRNVLYEIPVTTKCSVKTASNESDYENMRTYIDAQLLCKKYANAYGSLIKLSPEQDTGQQMIQHIPTEKRKTRDESLKTLDLITNISLTDDEPRDYFMESSDSDSIQSGEATPLNLGEMMELREITLPRMKNEQASDNSVHPKRPLCACTAYSCNKLFLFLYSCLYVIVGAGCLLVGVWLQFQTKDLESINKFLFIPVIMLMAVGFVIMINALFGIAAVVRENTCLLKFFLVVMVISFFTQVTIGVLAFLHRQKVPDLASDDFMHIIKEYHVDGYYKTSMDNLQIGFNCCGFESYMDYEENAQYHCGSAYPHRCGVPWSCCKKQARTGTLKLNCGHETRFNSTMPVEKIYTMGCTDTYLSWLSWNLDFVGIVGLGSAIPQIVGILLAYFFLRQVCEMQMWYRVGM